MAGVFPLWIVVMIVRDFTKAIGTQVIGYIHLVLITIL